MIQRVDAQLREEAARYRLVFSCGRCAQYDAEARECSLGYPSQPHESAELEDRDEVVFCKTFEMW